MRQGLPGANIGDKLKDVTFTATLDDKMKVTKLDGYDKFLDAIADGDADQKKLMKAMMPETTIRQSFGQTFMIARTRLSRSATSGTVPTRCRSGPWATSRRNRPSSSTRSRTMWRPSQ